VAGYSRVSTGRAGRKANTLKIYHGKLTKDKVGGQVITVTDGNREYPLKHIERHSPDGFNWGYGGSGPADTALSILTDCLGSKQAEALHQLFKWAYVAMWSDQFQITEKEIRDWARPLT